MLFTYVVMLAFVRTSGRRTIAQGDVRSFVLALIIGDLFDDMFWAEVPAAQFVVAVATLVLLHILSERVSWDEQVEGREVAHRSPSERADDDEHQDVDGAGPAGGHQQFLSVHGSG